MRSLIASVLVPAVLAGTGSIALAKPFDGGSGTVACADGTVTWSPAKVWPPNHKMKDVTIAYDEASDDGDTLTVTITSISHDDEGLEKGSTAGTPRTTRAKVSLAPHRTTLVQHRQR